MEDQSYLDKKYFIDNKVYNCPFCNRRNVKYMVLAGFNFDWSDSKKCFGILVHCSSCNNNSMHLSFDQLFAAGIGSVVHHPKIEISDDLDSHIFYSVPTSFFVLDERIPKVLRELISECEGCLKMNHLTGASACLRKAIYELTVIENAEGDDYESKIKSLKKKYPSIDPVMFDVLTRIKDMTSDKVHEQSWDKWDSRNLVLLIETLKTIFHDIYVVPQIKKERSGFIHELYEKVKGKGKKEEAVEEINIESEELPD